VTPRGSVIRYDGKRGMEWKGRDLEREAIEAGAVRRSESGEWEGWQV